MLRKSDWEFVILSIIVLFTLFIVVSDFSLAINVDLNDVVDANNILVRDDRVLLNDRAIDDLNVVLVNYQQRYEEQPLVEDDRGIFVRLGDWFNENILGNQEQPIVDNVTIFSELVDYGCYMDEPHCSDSGCYNTQRLINCPEWVNIEIPENQFVPEDVVIDEPVYAPFVETVDESVVDVIPIVDEVNNES